MQTDTDCITPGDDNDQMQTDTGCVTQTDTGDHNDHFVRATAGSQLQ